MTTKEMLHIAVDDMTEEQAMAIYAVVKLMTVNRSKKTETNAQKAYETIAKLRKPYSTITDEDDKLAYYEYLGKKYDNID